MSLFSTARQGIFRRLAKKPHRRADRVMPFIPASETLLEMPHYLVLPGH
jgi:hypothetical protein